MSTAPPSETREPYATEPQQSRRDRSRPPRMPLWIAPAALLIGFCGAIFLSIIVYLIGSAFGSSTTNPTPAVSLVASLVFDLAFVASALYFTVLRGGWRPADFGYRRIAWGLAASSFVGGRGRLLRRLAGLRSPPAHPRHRQAPELVRRSGQHRGDARHGGVRLRRRPDLRGVLLPGLPVRRAAGDEHRPRRAPARTVARRGDRRHPVRCSRTPARCPRTSI